MKKLVSISLLLFGSCLFGYSQYFIQMVENEDITSSPLVYAITNDDDSVAGKVTWAVLSNGNLTKITIKDEQDVKHKFSSDDIRLLGMKLTKMHNITAAYSASSFKQYFQKPRNEIMQREWAYFEQVLLPKKKNKFALLQLLNEGFDREIKVYLDPSANETGGVGLGDVQLTGGEDKSYLVLKGGKKAMLIKKSKYKKESLPLLYDNCPKFLEIYKDDKMKFKDFEEHVFVYDQLCVSN